MHATQEELGSGGVKCEIGETWGVWCTLASAPLRRKLLEGG